MSINEPISPEVLAHYGVLGMKWGVRKDGKPQGHQYGKAGQKRAERKARKAERKAEKAERAKLKTPKKATATTKRVIGDYNKMSDKQFSRKYNTSKVAYAKRVNKYGDPYKRRINKQQYSKEDYKDTIGKQTAHKVAMGRVIKKKALKVTMTMAVSAIIHREKVAEVGRTAIEAYKNAPIYVPHRPASPDFSGPSFTQVNPNFKLGTELVRR